MADQQSPQNINIKVPDEVLKGNYSNFVVASHTKEEFMLDFMNVYGQQGIAMAKVIVSPGHFKRIAAAINDNLKKYEGQFGKIDTQTLTSQPSSSESSKFGF